MAAGGFSYVSPYKLRTYFDHANAAHESSHEWETEFDCPCCNKTITRENYADLRDKMSSTQRKNHEKTHGGQALGRRPIFPVDISNVFICACHARKNLTGRLFHFAICQRITTEKKASDVHKYITERHKRFSTYVLLTDSGLQI